MNLILGLVQNRVHQKKHRWSSRSPLCWPLVWVSPHIVACCCFHVIISDYLPVYIRMISPLYPKHILPNCYISYTHHIRMLFPSQLLSWNYPPSYHQTETGWFWSIAISAWKIPFYHGCSCSNPMCFLLIWSLKI